MLRASIAVQATQKSVDGDKHHVDAALLKVPSQPSWRFVVGFKEGRVAVHILMIPFAHDEFGLRDVNIFGNVSRACPLDAMIRPQDLVSVSQLNRFERLRPRMRRSKRDMLGRMPVLSHHDVRKGRGDPIYDRHGLLALLYREASSAKETVLNINHDEHTSLVR